MLKSHHQKVAKLNFEYNLHSEYLYYTCVQCIWISWAQKLVCSHTVAICSVILHVHVCQFVVWQISFTRGSSEWPACHCSSSYSWWSEHQLSWWGNLGLCFNTRWGLETMVDVKIFLPYAEQKCAATLWSKNGFWWRNSNSCTDLYSFKIKICVFIQCTCTDSAV